jgi:predicted nucleotidyltransferase
MGCFDRTVAPDLRAVIESLSRRREVVAVYLFGSHARDEARPDSDVDVGVVIDFGLWARGRYEDWQHLHSIEMRAVRRRLGSVASPGPRRAARSRRSRWWTSCGPTRAARRRSCGRTSIFSRPGPNIEA